MAQTTQEPLGKVEQMLVDMIDGQPIVEAPENRIEGLLMELADAIEQGGGGDVTGVKGSAESTYRKGNVSISKDNIGLGNVDNTSDLDKPVSTAQQTVLDGKVDKVVDKGLSTNDYDNTAKGIVDGVTSALADKVDKETGKGLSTNDYTDADKAVVDGVTTALDGKADADDVIDSASYDSTNHQILFKNGATTLFSLDAAAFVKDGMVDDVEISSGNLVITFNTDAGKQAISIPLTDIFDPANYYTKTATDGLLADKADKVTSAVSGNFAGLDANGNLTDSSISPASVASKSATVLTSSDDLNNVTTPGFYYTANTDNPSNIPSGTNLNNNIIEVIKQGPISRCVQLFYSINGQKMWFRIGNSVTSPTAWSSWELIAFGSLATKADKVASATTGDIATLDANGNLTDSGKKASDFALTNDLAVIKIPFNSITQISGYYMQTGTRVYVHIELHNKTKLADWTMLTENGAVPSTSAPITNIRTKGLNYGLYIYTTGKIAEAGGGGIGIGDYTFDFVYDTEDSSYFYNIGLENANEVSGKADKVTSATNGDLASLDANGNPTDSGIPAIIIPSSAASGNKLVTEQQLAAATGGGQLKIVDLGTSYTAELKQDISSGKFEKAVVGGKLTINGHEYLFAHPDYWLHTGDTECTDHHMLVIPAGNIGTGKMNSTNITTGGYAGSDIKTGNNDNTALATAAAQIKADFGAANILTHRELFANAVTDGKASGWAWADSDIDLMNEVMVYGCNVWASHPGYETGIDKCQIKLFQERPDLITTRAYWWLRSVVSATCFAHVYSGGYAGYSDASGAVGVRPVFAIK